MPKSSSRFKSKTQARNRQRSKDYLALNSSQKHEIREAMKKAPFRDPLDEAGLSASEKKEFKKMYRQWLEENLTEEDLSEYDRETKALGL